MTSGPDSCSSPVSPGAAGSPSGVRTRQREYSSGKADRAVVVELPARRHGGDAGAGLGDPVDGGERDAAPSPGLDQGLRHGRAADDGDEGPQRRVGELGQLLHELVVGRHPAEVGHRRRGVGEQRETLGGVERAGNDDGATDVQHRVGEQVQPGDVEQRQHRQAARRRRSTRWATRMPSRLASHPRWVAWTPLGSPVVPDV